MGQEKGADVESGRENPSTLSAAAAGADAAAGAAGNQAKPDRSVVDTVSSSPDEGGAR